MGIFFGFLILFFLAYRFGCGRAMLLVHFDLKNLRSRPRHYGLYVALWGLGAGLGSYLLWTTIAHYGFLWYLKSHLRLLGLENIDFRVEQLRRFVALERAGRPWNLEDGVLKRFVYTLSALRSHMERAGDILGVVFFFAASVWALWKLDPHKKISASIDKVLVSVMFFCVVLAVLATVGIVLSLLTETLRFFSTQSITDFLFGLHWSPQTGSHFGAVPLFLGTIMITLIALCVAAPIGLMSAIYVAEYTTAVQRAYIKPFLEVLAGIPTVVYGFFAALVVAPLIQNLAHAVGLEASAESALAAGLIMGVMIIPFISSLADDVLRAVPESLRSGSMALGATPAETVKHVVLPAALPGIVGGLLLSVSRAIGETMIVSMAAGLRGNLTLNPLESVTTVTAQIVMLLNGDQAFDSPKTLSAFALGMVLFCFTFFMNWCAMFIVRRYRERY